MIITLDFETYFDDEYSLKKMTTEAYVRDARFKCHGFSAKMNGHPAQWYPPEELQRPYMQSQLARSAMLAHHAQFDGLILNHHFGIRPTLWLDTLSMARIALPHNRHSLDALSKHFGLPGKMHDQLANVKGVRHPNAAMLAGLGSMSCDDADKTYAIFQQIKDYIPREEFLTIDTTIRMFTEPVLRLDEPKMRIYYNQVVKDKKDALADLGLTKTDLGQDETVAAKFRELGVEPETKVTAKGNTKYAFAKTDQFMRDMLEDEDDRVATLTAARLGIKSTLNETRCERLLSMHARGPLAVYLRYAGAHPTRWSGGDSLNWQNFPRNEKSDGRAGEIRTSILAPPGKKIVVGDLSQIECRILNWLAGQEDVTEKFRNHEDPYIGIASQFYGYPVTKALPKERGTGKQLELSCLGPDTLVLTDQGHIPIVAITEKHRLWDGQTWVTHRGLLSRGVKSTIEVAGLRLTPDHLVLCGSMWREAQNLQNEHVLSRALVSGSANLPYRVIAWAFAAGLKQSWRDVAAALRSMRLTLIISRTVKVHAVITALKKLLATGLSGTTDTLTWFRMMHTDNAYLTASPQLLTAAQIQNIAVGETMGGAELPASGKKIAALFSHILSRCPAPLMLLWNWTASTIIKAINQATCASLRSMKIQRTAAQFTNSKKLLPTYDIACAGPRNRYTVVSDAGPLIVHNCGYGAGGPSIVQTAKLGTYGPPVYLSDEDGERAKNLYRSTHKMVTAMWYQTADAAFSVLEHGGSMEWGPMLVEKGVIWLPNGLPLWYTDFRYDGDEMFIFIRGRWRKMYGAKLVQHVCEALARNCISDAMLRLRQNYGYIAKNTTHDELWVVTGLDDTNALEYVLTELKRVPNWAPGLPLDAEGAEGPRYSK